MSKVVVSFGELLWDYLPEGPELGGAPSNFAYRMHSLGHEAIIVSRVGKDELGERALAQLKNLGLRTEFIQIDPNRPTGTVNVTVNASGEPTFEIVPEVAYDWIEFTPPLDELARRADCVCFGTLIQRSEQSRSALNRFVKSSSVATRLLDINLRKDCYTREVVEASLRKADLLKLNDQELLELGRMLEVEKADRKMSAEHDLGYLAEMIASRFDLKRCIVTRGAEGALGLRSGSHLSGRRGEEWEIRGVPGIQVKVEDTCGAGDAFTAGFMHQYLNGAGLEKCLEYGNALGALVAGTKGGTAPVSVKQVDDLICATDRS